LSLVRRFDGTDAELAALLGTSASMFSRLRSGKIQKIGRYLKVLEGRLGGGRPERFEDILSDLSQWSEESPELRETLISLHRFARESPEP
jgi:hypothetical protein